MDIQKLIEEVNDTDINELIQQLKDGKFTNIKDRMEFLKLILPLALSTDKKARKIIKKIGEFMTELGNEVLDIEEEPSGDDKKEEDMNMKKDNDKFLFERYDAKFSERRDDYDDIILFDGGGRGYTVNMTYSTWDEEAIEIGDTDDKGFEFIDRFFEDLEDLVSDRDIEYKQWMGWSSSPVISVPSDWLISDIEEDMRSGEKTEYNLHIKRKDRKKLTEEEVRYIEKELNVYNPAKRVVN